MESSLVHSRILLVEDDPLVAAALVELLEDADFDVDGPYANLPDGAEAIAINMPDGAVLDVQLQERDIFLIAEDLDQYGIPFLFCSGLRPGGRIEPLLQGHPFVAKDRAQRELIPVLRGLLH